jgi:exosortase/archaeosortase family protein
MKKEKNKVKNKKQTKIRDSDKSMIEKNIKILIRYLILLLFMFSLPIIYQIFTPITIFPVVFILKIFYNQVILNQNYIIINLKTIIQIIPSCIAGSAYLLLLILNLTVPMNFRKRIYSLLFSIVLLLLFNILRIVLLTSLSINNFIFFDLTHKIFWYGISTLFVVIIWFVVVRIFDIKEIPIYTDVKYLVENIKKNN